MNNILLRDTDEYGPASVQLRKAGKAISDSWYQDSSEQIFDEFKIHANKKYRLVSCDDLGDLDECGLCGHDIRYGCTLESIGEPLTTHHPDLDTSVTWPEHMVIGTTCVQMLGMDSYVMRFVRSCFKKTYCPSFKTNKFGYVYLWGDILKHPEMWDSSYEQLVLPHSVFNLIPKEIMDGAGLRVHFMRNAFDPKRKLEKTIYRSHRSRNGKWRTAYTLNASEDMYKDGSNDYHLATVLTREDAHRVCEVYYNTIGRK